MFDSAAPRVRAVEEGLGLIRIENLTDPRLDDYRGIPDPELLVSRGIFIAEGRLVVRRLLESHRFSTRSVLVTPAALDSLADIASDLRDLPIYVADRLLLSSVAGFDVHRGCLAAVLRPPGRPWRELVTSARLLIVLEQVGNVDNVGGIFRNAAAFGVDAVLLEAGCADPLYRKAVRTSMGASLQIPFGAMTDWPADITRLRDAGFTVVALSPSRAATSLETILTRIRNSRVALLVGHEGSGLSDAAMKAADVCARIPVERDVDSLNVSAAAAIALYALTRTRLEP